MERRGVKRWNLLSVVHSVDPAWVAEIAPQMVEKYNDEVVYDSETDSVSRNASCRIKGTSHDLPSVVEDVVSPEERAAAFARYAARDPDGDFAEENEYNLEVAEQYNNLRLRYGGDIEENESFSGKFTRDTLERLYSTVFKNGHIYTMKDLNDRGINLHFSLSDFAPEEVQGLIEEENPESIIVGEKEYPVTYEERSMYESDQLFHASIVVEEDDLFAFDALPKLPSGRLVRVCVSDHSTGTYDLHALKEKVRDQEVDRRWGLWEERHPVRNMSFDFSDPEFSVPELPEKVVYAKDPITDEDLFAYPAFYLAGWGGCCLRYYQGKGKAEQSHENAMSYIEKSIKEAEHKRQFEIVRSALGNVEENIAFFAEALEAWDKPWLKHHSPHDLNDLREEVRQVSEVVHQHAPDAEKMLGDLRRKIADISAIDSAHQETQNIVGKNVKEMLIAGLGLHISSDIPLYNLFLGDVHIQDAIKDRISFMKYEYNSHGDRYAVAAELSASDRDGGQCLVAQIIVRDDGLVRVTDYWTDAMQDSECFMRSPEDGRRWLDDDVFVWTGELLDPDSFTVKDYNIVPERVPRNVSNRKSGRSGRRHRQRHLSREDEDVVVSNTNVSENLNPMQAAFQDLLNKNNE